MFERTHIPEARWWVVEADDKKRARLNCINHLLSQIPYEEVEHPAITLPGRVHNPDYIRGPCAGKCTCRQSTKGRFFTHRLERRAVPAFSL